MSLATQTALHRNREPFIGIVDKSHAIRHLLVSNETLPLAVNSLASSEKIVVHSAENYMPIGLPWYFDLRKEAREGRVHFETDKLVYVSKVLDCKLYSSLFVSEEDFGIRPWIEAHFVLSGKRNGHYSMILEYPFLDNRNSASDFKKRAGIDGVNADYPMFIRIPEEIEPPERVGFVRFPVAVWLKRLHGDDCTAWHTSSGSDDLSLCARAIFDANWEACLTGGMPFANFSQCPCQMVEGAAQVANKVASDQTKVQDFEASDGLAFNGEELPFQILICRDSIKIFGLAQDRGETSRGETSIESVQVNLRPLHFKVALLGYHDWPLLSEVLESDYAVA
jgi:hypothetical protein